MTEDLQQRQVLTITQLNRRARLLLETHLPLLWVRGEISNFANPGSGHWYFTLKDNDAQIRCAMFRNRNSRVSLRPKNGDQVLVRGRVGLYENRGEYQLIIEHLEADGAGLLQQRFDALKERLQEEGLFDPDNKRALPPFPTRIGIVTSPTGAAVRDILHVIKRRCPWLEVDIFPVAVQGQEAIPQIVKAIAFANRLNNCDVLILARGGGSIEDLWAFNEELVARAIHTSNIPVVSAVGHETDFTIADFVADVRAPTPSAAAEIVSPDGRTINDGLMARERRLIRQATRKLEQYRFSLAGLSRRLRSPADKLRQQSQQLDHLEMRMTHAWRRAITAHNSRLQLLQQRLDFLHPQKQLTGYQQKLQGFHSRLAKSTAFAMSTKRQHLHRLAGTLNTVSPLKTLDRGYSITLDQSGDVIDSVRKVSISEDINVRLRDGLITCDVREIDEFEAHA